MIETFILNNKKIGQRLEKEKIRCLTSSYICEYFLQYNKRKITFLTLPGVWWHFEKKVSERFRGIKTHFTGCEIDENLFKLASIKMPQSNKGLRYTWNKELNCTLVTNSRNCILFYTDIFNIFKLDREYDCIWLDIQTPITIELFKKISFVLEKLNKDIGCFVLTVLAARENDIRFENLNRADYIQKNIEFYKLKLIHQWKYKDTSPMIHSIFIRKNTIVSF